MTKKIFRSTVAVGLAVLAASLVIIMSALYSYFGKLQEQQLKDELSIAAAAMAKGLPVMSAETIGMAQKGGAVFSHLRIGEGVKSPMIRRGTADLLLAFEPAEAVRMLPYLR